MGGPSAPHQELSGGVFFGRHRGGFLCMLGSREGKLTGRETHESSGRFRERRARRTGIHCATLSTLPVSSLSLGVPVPFLALGGLYLFNDGFREILNEGVRLLVAGDTQGLEAWGERLGPAAIFATRILWIPFARSAWTESRNR